jgi:probable HAF family extracellular repeat protein
VTVLAPAASVATGINNAGAVVGFYPYSDTSTHAFLNRHDTLVDLGVLKGTDSRAVAINDKDHILGHWITATGEQRGFIHRDGKAHDIGINPGWNTVFTGINTDGYISAFGTLRDTFDGAHAFLRSPEGSYRDIGALPFDNPMTNAWALNKHKQITGGSGPLLFPEQPLHAYLWARGHMLDLGGFGSDPNVGQAINDCGQVAGYASVAGGPHSRVAFLYSKGVLIDIDGRPATEDRFSEGNAINKRGHIVGNSNHLSGFVYRGKKMESLNLLIDLNEGWDIRIPRAINDVGQIAANAWRDGQQYAVRLDPLLPSEAAGTPCEEIDEQTDVRSSGRE